MFKKIRLMFRNAIVLTKCARRDTYSFESTKSLNIIVIRMELSRSCPWLDPVFKNYII